ncbi:MAG: argininosuccinate lyase [Candidatus Nanohaloarchaea archaeon]
MTLWSEDPSTSSTTEEYTREPDGLEQQLLPYDILGNIAHVRMLEEQGYLEEQELEAVEQVLREIYAEKPEVDAEDVHTFVEEEVTERTAAGKKIHTGRSRNDQVVLDTRLYMKEGSVQVAREALELVEALNEFAEEENQLVPGYTHQRQAMPSSTGLWASSFADAIIDDLELLRSVYGVLNRNPLGAAAGYGTSLEIDREHTAELLGFSSVQENPVYCVNRGKHELMLLQALDQLMMDLGKMCEDLINFSGDQQIFEIPGEFCTGSSIMPQKENPDVLEIARGKSSEFTGHVQAVRATVSKLPSGYNRDTQLTKKHLFQSLEDVSETLEVLEELVSGLEVSDGFEVREEVHAAHTANRMVESGIPFREAHHRVKKEQDYVKDFEVKEPRSQDAGDLEEFWSREFGELEEVKSELLGNSFEGSRE